MLGERAGVRGPKRRTSLPCATPLPGLFAFHTDFLSGQGEDGRRGSSVLEGHAHTTSQHCVFGRVGRVPPVHVLGSLCSFERALTPSAPFQGVWMWAFFNPRAAHALALG